MPQIYRSKKTAISLLRRDIFHLKEYFSRYRSLPLLHLTIYAEYQVSTWKKCLNMQRVRNRKKAFFSVHCKTCEILFFIFQERNLYKYKIRILYWSSETEIKFSLPKNKFNSLFFWCGKKNCATEKKRLT